MTDLSNNAQCVLRILQDVDSLTTSEILERAKDPSLSDVCIDCAGGDTFVVAANQLVEQGMITKKFGKGGYRWHLVRE